MKKATLDFWINQAFFQLAWPACVVGAAYGTLLPCAALIGAMLLSHFHPALRRPGDLQAIVMFVATGIVLDTLWVQSGVLTYALAVPLEGAQPLWLAGLWVALGLAANHSLRIFQRRWKLWVLLATLGSPLSYTMAARLGAVEWTGPNWLVLLCIGPVWGLVTGLLFRQLGKWASADASVAADRSKSNDSKSKHVETARG